MKYRIALSQMSVIPGNVAANEAKAQIMLEEAAAQGADFCVLPELWNIGYDLANLDRLAQDSRGSSVRLLKQAAADYEMQIVGGSIGERRDGAYYNTLVYIDERGELMAKYRKVHLFPLTLAEDRHFKAGQEWGLTEAGALSLGFMLCYDLRFPEFCRNLALRGAKIIFVPAQWPSARIDHWMSLLKARAIENQVFMVGVNAAGGSDQVAGGHSLLVDPLGRVLARGGEEETLLMGEINSSRLEEVRNSIPVYRDRKNILDEIDNSYL